MATNKPRIQCYLKDSLVSPYEKFKQERGVTGDSEALNLILSDYFSVEAKSSPDLDSRLTPIERRLDYLEMMLSKLTGNLSSELLYNLLTPNGNSSSELESELTIGRQITSKLLSESLDETLNHKLNDGKDELQLTESNPPIETTSTNEVDSSNEKIEKVEQVTSEVTGELTSNSPLGNKIKHWETTNDGFRPCGLKNKKEIVDYYISTGMTEEKAKAKYQAIADSKNAGRKKES